MRTLEGDHAAHRQPDNAPLFPPAPNVPYTVGLERLNLRLGDVPQAVRCTSY